MSRRRLDVASVALLLVGLASGCLAYWLITAHGLNPLILVPGVAAATTGASHIAKYEAAPASRGGVVSEEAIEMEESGELRTRLQFVEHDLQHVAQERDRAKDALASALARHEALREAVGRLAEELDRVDELFSVADRLRAILATQVGDGAR